MLKEVEADFTSREPLRALLIEDNPDDALLFEAMIREQGKIRVGLPPITLIVAKDLSSGFNILSQQPVDVVLLDLGLPGSSRIDTLQAFQQHAPEITVIILTGFNDDNFALKAIRAGAEDYLVKDQLTPDMLHRTIQYAHDRRLNRQALHESDQRFRSVVQSATDAVISINSQGVVVSWNRGAEVIFGYDEDEMLGQSLHPIMPERFQDRHQSAMRRLRRGSVARRVGQIFEKQGLRKDGSEFPIELSLSTWQAGDEKCYTCIIRDITEPVQAKNVLQQERDRAQKYLDIAGVMIVAINAKGEVNLINRKGSEILGYKQEEIIGKNWFDSFLPARVKDQTKTVFDQLVAGEINPVEYYENPVLTKEGEERFIAWHNTLLKDDQGNIIGTLSSGEDITQRKLAEEAILSNTERLRILHEIDNEILKAESPQAIAHGALHRVREIVPCQRASVALFDLDDESVVIRTIAAVPEGDRFRVGSEYRVPKRMFRDFGSLKEGNVVKIDDIQALPSPEPTQRAMLAEGIRSYINIPLILQDELIGSFNLEYDQAGSIKDDHIDIAREIANSVGIAIQQAQLLETEQRRRKILELIEQVSVAMRDAQSPGDLLPILVRETKTLVEADAGAILLLQDDDFILTDVHASEHLKEILQTHRTTDGTHTRLIYEGKPVYCFEQALGIPGLASSVMLPLKSDVKIYGALNLYWTRHKEFNEDEKHLLNAIAEMAAIAIEKLRVLEQLEQQVADRTWETRILYELAEISASSADLKSGLTQSLDKILTAVGGQAGTIHLLDDDRTKYEMVVHRGLTSELESDLRSASLEDPFWGRIAEKGEPVLIMNLRAETHVSPALQRSHLKCFLGAPVMVEGIALGIISIFYTLDHNPSLDNIGLLSLVSDQIGLAVERSYLREQARDTVIALERQRLARELHDSVTQSLYSLSFNAKASRNFARAGRWDRVDENLNAVQEIAEQASKEMRLLVYELMPTSLEEQGLISVLEQRLEFVERRSGMDTELVAVGDFDLPTNILASMHRIAEEALNNTLNHASASKIIVRLISRGKRIEMEIEDNGKGFNQSTSPGGMGLQNMHERAKSLGGKLTISSEPDMGTSVRFVIEEVPA